MPLYEALVHSVHYERYAPLRNLLSSTASFVRSRGGAVRQLEFKGTQSLLSHIRSKADKQLHSKADVWSMHFDTNPPTLQNLHARLRADPRVLRYTVLKQGTKFDEVVKATNPFTGITSAEQSISHPSQQ